MNSEELLRSLFRHVADDVDGRTVLKASAAELWPRQLLAAAESARLLEVGPPSDEQVCPGCARACVMTAVVSHDRVLIPCNQTDVNYGLIELEPSALRQWHASRARLVAFVARELKLSPTDRDGWRDRVRLGTWKGARLRRAATLEFKNSMILHLGDAEIEVCELLKLDGDRIFIDQEELEIRAAQSADLQTGDKRYQPSRAKQQHAATLTRLRNQRLQEMATKLWQEHTTWKKTAIADAILESGEFNIRKRATIERLIRHPRKRRRKMFA